MILLLVFLVVAVAAVVGALVVTGRDGYGRVRTDPTRLSDPRTGWR